MNKERKAQEEQEIQEFNFYSDLQNILNDDRQRIERAMWRAQAPMSEVLKDIETQNTMLLRERTNIYNTIEEATKDNTLSYEKINAYTNAIIAVERIKMIMQLKKLDLIEAAHTHRMDNVSLENI